MTEERLSSTRTIAAPPAAVFAVLTDPTRHGETEPGDWVRDAIDAEPITEVGQRFSMNMYLKRLGEYVMTNEVTVFEPERAIGWLPGQLKDDGSFDPGGWWWRYDLELAGPGTAVTLTYDYTDTPQSFRDFVGGMPPFPPEFLDRSLEALERTVLTEEG